MGQEVDTIQKEVLLYERVCQMQLNDNWKVNCVGSTGGVCKTDF